MASNFLIEPKELVPHLGKKSWVVVDCRADLNDHELGLRQYHEGHIPSAIHAHLETDLSGTPGLRGRHPLPTRVNFWGFIRSIGISNDTHVVAYDERHGSYATRFWWLMRWLGHSHTKVLNGGMDAWRRQDMPQTQTILEAENGTYSLRSPLTKQIDMTDIDGSKQIIVDARTLDRFKGLNEPIDHTAGHIPDAICLPFQENLDDEGNFKQNHNRFAHLDQTEKPIVCYCGSGVSATHNIFAILLAGLPEPALYPGSWSEWIEHPDNPIATNDSD